MSVLTPPGGRFVTPGGAPDGTGPATAPGTTSPVLSPFVKARAQIGLAKRFVARGEETARTALGLAGRRLGLRDERIPAPLFEVAPVTFRAYRPGATLVPVDCVTPAGDECMHTFFDVCPLSASGRFLAVTRLPFAWHLPYPGDLAEVCVIDLVERTIQVVHRTGGWALQLGANLQWHPLHDHLLYCNDLVEGRGAGVELDLQARCARRFGGPFYTIAPDGSHMLGPALDLINATQDGYGVPEPFTGRRRLARGAATAEGIWRTDLRTGRTDLLVSIADIVGALPDGDLLRTGRNYLFHTKFNAQGTRVMQVLRTVDLPDAPGTHSQCVTLDIDGSHVRSALPYPLWDKGGHHVNWLPDGEHLVMNLVLEGVMRFVRFAHDGSGLAILPGDRRGSGHPTMDPSERYLVTDAYQNEGFDLPGDDVPIRLVDYRADAETRLAAVNTGPRGLRARRIDPHPAWSRDFRRLVFNAFEGGRRQVLIADMTPLFAQAA